MDESIQRRGVEYCSGLLWCCGTMCYRIICGCSTRSREMPNVSRGPKGPCEYCPKWMKLLFLLNESLKLELNVKHLDVTSVETKADIWAPEWFLRRKVDKNWSKMSGMSSGGVWILYRAILFWPIKFQHLFIFSGTSGREVKWLVEKIPAIWLASRCPSATVIDEILTVSTQHFLFFTRLSPLLISFFCIKSLYCSQPEILVFLLYLWFDFIVFLIFDLTKNKGCRHDVILKSSR